MVAVRGVAAKDGSRLLGHIERRDDLTCVVYHHEMLDGIRL